MNFASLEKLPIIFACENNLYATHVPIRECRVGQDIYKIAEPFCIHTSVVDGNDVLAVYEAGKSAVERCRCGDTLWHRYRQEPIRLHSGLDERCRFTKKMSPKARMLYAERFSFDMVYGGLVKHLEKLASSRAVHDHR